MKIAVCAQGRTLDDQVDPRFGRCGYFLLVEGDEVRAMENPSLGAPGGAGVQAAQFLADQGVEALLVGNLGPNAAQALEAAGIEVYRSQPGSAGENISLLKEGQLEKLTGATVGSHFGMGAGRGRRSGQGNGPGRAGGPRRP